MGRVYRTTPRCLDDLRDMVSLSAEAIDSYQLGTHHVVVDGTRRAGVQELLQSLVPARPPLRTAA